MSRDQFAQKVQEISAGDLARLRSMPQEPPEPPAVPEGKAAPAE